jgi:flagellar motor switch/type III secretory pathway protein FliN
MSKKIEIIRRENGIFRHNLATGESLLNAYIELLPDGTIRVIANNYNDVIQPYEISVKDELNDSVEKMYNNVTELVFRLKRLGYNDWNQDSSSDEILLDIKNTLIEISSKLNRLKSKIDQFTATSGQTVFTLANIPLGDVAISINGTRIAKNAITVVDSQVTYVPANNLGYVLEAGDIVILDY